MATTAEQLRAASGRTWCAGTTLEVEDVTDGTARCPYCGEFVQVRGGRLVAHPNPGDVAVYRANAATFADELAEGLRLHGLHGPAELVEAAARALRCESEEPT